MKVRTGGRVLCAYLQLGFYSLGVISKRAYSVHCNLGYLKSLAVGFLNLA